MVAQHLMNNCLHVDRHASMRLMWLLTLLLQLLMQLHSSCPAAVPVLPLQLLLLSTAGPRADFQPAAASQSATAAAVICCSVTASRRCMPQTHNSSNSYSSARTLQMLDWIALCGHATAEVDVKGIEHVFHGLTCQAVP